MSDTAPAPFAGLLNLHRSLLLEPGPQETCAAWRAYCREHPGPRWIPAYDFAAYRETPDTALDLAGAEHFHEIEETRLDAAILRVVDTEGPVHRRLLTHRLLRAAGFQRAGSRIQARIDERRAALAAAAELELRDDFTGRREQFVVPRLRDWSPLPDSLRQLDHVHETERMLCVLHALVEAGHLDEDAAMNDGLYRIGFIRLTEQARQRLERPLRALEGLGIVERRNGRLAPTARAFPRPPGPSPQQTED